MFALISALIIAAPWSPPKYWEGAPLRSCMTWPDGGRCCGYKGIRTCGYVVCDGEVVAEHCPAYRRPKHGRS